MPKKGISIILIDTFKDEAEEIIRIVRTLKKDSLGVKKRESRTALNLVKEIKVRLD